MVKTVYLIIMIIIGRFCKKIQYRHEDVFVLSTGTFRINKIPADDEGLLSGDLGEGLEDC
jgi:hypothetical protein